MDFEQAYNQHQVNLQLINSIIGQPINQIHSADWGGIRVWSIKGSEFEGVFLKDMQTCNNEFSFVLMERKFNSKLGEEEDQNLFVTNLDETVESDGSVDELIKKILEY